MIVKFPPPRRDSRTNFRELFRYITEGLPENGADLTTFGFEDLTQYITAQHAVDLMGDKVDKTLAVEIGNISSFEQAAPEMYAVASKNLLVKDPVLHYIISWPENEHPPVDDVLAAARYTLDALGLSEHQYVVAVHINTDNLHAHIEVNKVHPVTYKSKNIEWSHKTLHKAARELEIMYGWRHDRGLYSVVELDGKKVVVPSVNGDNPERPSSGRADLFETWSGQESFETWCKNVPAKELKQLVERGLPTSWNDIHTVMAQHGIELQYSGGGYRVSTLSGLDDKKPVSIAASKVFRFLKPNELEKSLGKFIPYDPTVVTVQPERTYKRDPLKRLVRKEERRQAREELFARYQKEKREIGDNAFALKAIAKREAEKHWGDESKKLKATYAARREKLKSSREFTPIQKQLFYMELKLTHTNALAALKEECQKIRDQFLDEIAPKQSWRAWIEGQAKNGDQAAISALRGMAYRDRRGQGQQLDADGSSIEEFADTIADPDDGIFALEAPTEKSERDPVLQPLRELKWTVTTNGRIVYSFGRKDKHGDAGFIDEGRRIIFGRKEVSDRALRAALEYSKLKWGPTLQLAGGDPVFQERVIKMAVQLGMRIGNPEFHQTQMQAIRDGGPVAQKTSSRLSTDKEIQLMLQKQPKMKFDYAAHQANGQTYEGRIALVTETHVMQQTGQNQMTLHEVSRLGSIPKTRRPATITYRNGTAIVEQRIHQGRKAGR